TTVTSSLPNGATYNQPITFTATVQAASGPGTPTGTVQFQIDGVNVGAPATLTGGSARRTTTLAVGAHTVVAIYLRDTVQFAGSDDVAHPLSQAVNPGTVATTAGLPLFYTQYTGAVGKVALSYDGTGLTLGTTVTLATNIPADGLIFLPNGN